MNKKLLVVPLRGTTSAGVSSRAWVYVRAVVTTSPYPRALRSEPELRHLVAGSVMLARRLAKKRAGRACPPRRVRAGSSSAPYGAELHPPRPGVYRGALVHPHSEQSS